MSDLISRKALLAKVVEANPMGGMIGGKFIEDLIKSEDCAYDVDGVVEELKRMSGIQFDGRNESYELNWCISTDRAIEIVKGAVKDGKIN